MAKFFRIKNKILRYGLSFVVLCIISTICIAGFAAMLYGIGYASIVYASNLPYLSTWITYSESSDIMEIITQGFVVIIMDVIIPLFVLFFIILGTVAGTKSIANNWFNSIDNKKKETSACKT